MPNVLTFGRVEALLNDQDLADQVWELWHAGVITDDLAAWAWGILAESAIERRARKSCRRASKQLDRKPVCPEMTLNEMARVLESSDDYRVVRRYSKPALYNPDDGTEKLIGLCVDVETTGLDSQSDQIIQLGIVTFEFARDGRIFRITNEFEHYEDPGVSIPREIVRLTGITDEDVRGQRIDDNKVDALIRPAAIVIAHNADFDRKFCERRFPQFAEKAWGCSMANVPWRDEGIESSKLEYIAYRFGFFFLAHTALSDCLAALHLLAGGLPSSGSSVLKSLLETARMTTIRIWAEDSPYDQKDILKSRGYQWNAGTDGRPKAWFFDVAKDGHEAELQFLESEIYGHEVNLRTDKINAFNRFSARV